MVNMKFDCLLLHDYLGVDIFMVQTNSWCRYIQDYLGADISLSLSFLYFFEIWKNYRNVPNGHSIYDNSLSLHYPKLSRAFPSPLRSQQITNPKKCQVETELGNSYIV